MEEIKISGDVFEQIKDFNHWQLTEEQVSLIDKLILSDELKERYKKNGLCKECKQPNTHYYNIIGYHYHGYDNYWCQPCSSKHFQQNFKNWTSGNHEV